MARDTQKILESMLSPYERYCTGYNGQGGYLVALVMTVGVFKKTFSHPGSTVLDSIVAYDRAETSQTYLGQINMSLVSSFCGPTGLIWGYDIARESSLKISELISPAVLQKFQNVKIRNGANLRIAAKELFGTRQDLHFPLLPGTHVPCAGRFRFEEGPANLYCAIAIGIPADRDRTACLLMEDVGATETMADETKEKIIQSAIESVLEIGKSQGIKYKEIFIDFVAKQIKAGEIGCALVVMPYFHLAKKAHTPALPAQNLAQWRAETKKHFLKRFR